MDCTGNTPRLEVSLLPLLLVALSNCKFPYFLLSLTMQRPNPACPISVLFILTLVYFSLSLHRHRLDGFHSTYGTPQTTRDTQELNTTNGSASAAAPVNANMGPTTTV
jgi:hypothetical protein